MIHAFGPGLQQAQVGVPTSFTVDGHRAVDSIEDIKVLVTSKINSCEKLFILCNVAPSKYECPMEIVNNHDRTWTIYYVPYEVGETFIDIFLGDELVNGSPFKVNIFDIHQIRISDLHDGLIGHWVNFHIDASDAGVGQLEIVVQDGQIACHARAYGSFQFDASFYPCEPGRYFIEIKFNGIPISGNSKLIT